MATFDAVVVFLFPYVARAFGLILFFLLTWVLCGLTWCAITEGARDLRRWLERRAERKQHVSRKNKLTNARLTEDE